MKDMRIFSAWLGLLLCATVFLCPVLAYAQPEEASLQTYRGQVLSIEEAEDNPLSEAGYQTEALNVEVKILSGPFKQQTREIYHVTSGNPGYDIYVQPGDKVLLEAEVVDEQLGNVYIADHIRDTYVYGLFALFVVAVLLVGGKSGLKSLLSLVVIAILLLQVFLPLLLRGYQPLPLAMLVAALAILVTMFMVGGVSYKTLAAVIGTVGGVMLAGLLAYVFGQLAKLSGLSHTEAQMLFYIPQEVYFNYKGLLFAGMMIGALGAIMDVGMSIASAMFEVKTSDPKLVLAPHALRYECRARYHGNHDQYLDSRLCRWGHISLAAVSGLRCAVGANNEPRRHRHRSSKSFGRQHRLSGHHSYNCFGCCLVGSQSWQPSYIRYSCCRLSCSSKRLWC